MTEVAMNQPVESEPDGLRARVLLRPDDEQVLSYTRLESPRDALARALKEYIEPAAINWTHGRLLKFSRISIGWETPEEPAEWPSLSIVGEGPGSYEDSEFSPRLISVGSKEQNLWLKQSSELKQNFILTVWSNDPVERAGLLTILEDLLEPALFMTGVRLELPYYFNARATYEKLSVMYKDAEGTAIQRWCLAGVMVTAHVTQYVPVGHLPLFSATGPRVLATVTSPNDQTPPPPAAIPPEAVGGIEGVSIDDRVV